MNPNAPLKIVIAETSAIIRSGLAAVLKRIPNLHIQPIEIATPESLRHYLQLHAPAAVIANPTFGGWFDPSACQGAAAEGAGSPVRCMALLSSVIDPAALKAYDGQISICDDAEAIARKLHRLLRTAAGEGEETGSGNSTEALSQREKEIVTCVVKGMTNKAIADQLCLSIHTIITHRRNIARKLQIHSSAGLTIYAIVNKLVELGDIKDQL